MLSNQPSVTLTANYTIIAAVQHERGPRSATVRRKVAMYFSEFSHKFFDKASYLPLVGRDSTPEPSIPGSQPLAPNNSNCPFTISSLCDQADRQTDDITMSLVPWQESLFHELSARALFQMVHWVRSLQLNDEAILTLLKSNWQKLFLLTAVELRVPLHDRSLMLRICERVKAASVVKYGHEINQCVILYYHLSSLALTTNEIRVLKYMLFVHPRSPDCRSSAALDDIMKVCKPLDITTKIMHVVNVFAGLMNFSEDFIQQMFFHHTIGDIDVLPLLSDMVLQTKS